jgi:hypothetical protein
MSGAGSPFGAPKGPSPFEADRARKGREELSSGEAPQGATKAAPQATTAMAPQAAPVQPPPMAIAPRPMGQPLRMPAIEASSGPFDNGSALAVAPQPQFAAAPVSAPQTATAPQAALDVEAIRTAVLEAMESSGSKILVSALDEGEWSAEGNTVSVKVSMSAAMVEVSFGRDQERAATAAATRIAGVPVRLRLVGGAVVAAQPKRAPRQGSGDGASLKTKAADEPVVKRMMEKFGAEIRIVMDRSER